MEPPIRIRALQLGHLQDSRIWPRTKCRNKCDTALVARSRKDSPLDGDGEETNNRDDSSPNSPRQRRPLTKALMEKQRRQFLRFILASSVSKTSIHSPATFRESLFGGFVNDLTWMQSTSSCYMVLQQLRSYFESGQSEGPMTAATEALLLAQFSGTVGDPQYVAEAQQKYGLAMSRCARKIASKPGTLGDWVEALAAIQSLGTCEMYDDLSQGSTVWIRHSDGMLAILRQLPIQPEDLANGYLKMVIYNAVDTSLATAIWARTPHIFGEQHWLDLLSSNCDGQGWCLQHIVCRLPTLLCRMEELRLEDTSDQETVEILEELLMIERDLLRWLHEWYMSYEDTPIRTTSVNDFPDFIRRHKDSTSLFPKVFDFPSPVEAYGHLIYYDWLNIVRQAICDLHSRPQCSNLISEDDRERALHNATECADVACMLAPYSAQMERTEPSKPLSQVLGRAEDWYDKTEHVEKLKFVRSIFGDEAKHAEDHKLLRWQDVNGFLMRRVMLQHCVGPPRCILKGHCVSDPT